MTQVKLKNNDLNERKAKNDAFNAENNLKSKYINDKYLQIAAWVLLTLGLCIIVTTFYLAINQRVEVAIDDSTEATGIEVDTINDGDIGVNVDIIGRSLSKKIIEIGNRTTQGCEEKLCKMVCVQAENFFETLNNSMQLSECNSLDTLMIYAQHFQRDILRNGWIDADRTVHELAIINSQIKRIKSDAFNTPMFSTVFLMYWRNLNLEVVVESGALLGLHSLKYLMIVSKIKSLDRAFFQPVQTTILYLKIHAGLKINKEGSFFGISVLNKLEYADLSRNNLKGPITKRTFAGSPNLKYLLLARCQITAIREDAFQHLAGKLVYLDLSHNMLTALSDKILKPLLNGNARCLLNMAMNNFNCDCEIRPLAKVYQTHRNQFMDALYCKAPHELYGKFIDEVVLDSENCGIDDWNSDDTTMRDSTDNENDVVSEPVTSFVASTTTDTDDVDTDDTLKCVQMRCWHSADSYETAEPRSVELLPGESNNMTGLNTFETESSVLKEMSAFKYPIDVLRFAQPRYEFELHIFENLSVKVEIVDNTDTSVNFLWFAEDVKNFDSNLPCMVYTKPYLLTEPLIENTTYTFCLVPATSNGIAPFNCLPLYVPPITVEEDVWIPREHKQFTIGMLCLLFLMSTFAGAMIAYFGIRAYPDLLEGSKNVLVVKKSDKTCYVSTITEADYMKKASLKKPSSSSIQTSSLPDTPSTLSPPSTMSTAERDRMSSLKSSSTLFKDTLNPMPGLNDEYERPKPMDQEVIYANRSIPNTYVATSPRRSPPPLPKRSSTENATEHAF